MSIRAAMTNACFRPHAAWLCDAWENEHYIDTELSVFKKTTSESIELNQCTLNEALAIGRGGILHDRFPIHLAIVMKSSELRAAGMSATANVNGSCAVVNIYHSLPL